MANHRPLLSTVLAAAIIGALACQPKVNQEAFEDLHRAGTAMGVAIENGVNYMDYNKEVKALATEIELASDRAKTDEEKALVAAYRDALKAYQDAAALWKVKVESTEDMWKGQIPVSGRYSDNEADGGFTNEDVKRVADAYSLETTVYEIEAVPGANWTGLAPEAIQQLWLTAGKHAEAAAQLYRGDN